MNQMLTKRFNSKDINTLYNYIAESENIVLTCHVRPDGDAIGSTLGFYHLLLKMGKNPKVITPDLPPRTLSFMPGFKDVIPYTKYQEFSERIVNDAQLIICCDFNKPQRQDILAPLIQNAKCKKVLVDHHLDPDYFADLTFSYPKMSSASELVFRLIAAMGLISEMDKNSATCVCTGIITDTRNLSVNCDDPELYIIIMKLIEKGVDKQMIVKEALETKSYDSIKLHAYAISEKLKVYDKHQAAVITLNKEELSRFKYEKGDSEGLVNEPLQIKGVRYSFFLREDPDCIKVSARSVRNFPVNKICEDYFNGGGHIQAAGGEFIGTLDECEELLIKAMPRYDEYLKKN